MTKPITLCFLFNKNYSNSETTSAFIVSLIPTSYQKKYSSGTMVIILENRPKHSTSISCTSPKKDNADILMNKLWQKNVHGIWTWIYAAEVLAIL